MVSQGDRIVGKNFSRKQIVNIWSQKVSRHVQSEVQKRLVMAVQSFVANLQLFFILSSRNVQSCVSLREKLTLAYHMGWVCIRT